jgi:hypothetical protein
MSLEACPTCGYALSTTTAECRHCSTAAKLKHAGLHWSLQNCAYAAAAICLIYAIFFRH